MKKPRPVEVMVRLPSGALVPKKTIRRGADTTKLYEPRADLGSPKLREQMRRMRPL